jgi:hypothetical protein
MTFFYFVSEQSNSLFVLKTLINKYVHKNKRKLFVCFVDLQKAIDSVWRNEICQSCHFCYKPYIPWILLMNLFKPTHPSDFVFVGLNKLIRKIHGIYNT